MYKLEVGKLYNPDRRTWPDAGQVRIIGEMVEFVLFASAPTRHEAEAWKDGSIDFALWAEGSQILLCYQAQGKRGGIPWSDAPFDIRRQKPEEQLPPPDPETLSAEGRAMIQMILVNSLDGKIAAMRQVSVSPEFTRALFGAVRNQLAIPHDRDAYDRELDALYARFPATADLVAACPIRSRGGV